MFIYAIRKKSNLTHVLIGQTIQKNPQQRWKSHKRALKRNIHKNPHIQNAWNKYGEDAFEFVVLTEARNQDELDKLEWVYEKLFGYYNLREGGGGGKFSDEAKRRMSAARVGKVPWNKGLTKEIDDRILRDSIARRGKGNPMYGRNWSPKQRKIMRKQIGENHPNAKLTEKDVMEIRRRHQPYKVGFGKLAKEYGVDKKLIINIVKRQIWKHVK